MADLIPHVRLSLGDEEIAAATRVIKSGYLASGPEGEGLERELAQLSQQRGAVLLTSGTTALHVGLLALGVQAGDEVIIPAYSCQALLNAIYYVGATPRLADIDPQTFNLDLERVRRVISSRTKAIIAPHMYGLMADITALQTLGVPVLEDCAMAIGATSGGAIAGSLGRAAIFSFYATKIITGGEGGALVSSDQEVVERAQDLREYDKKLPFIVRYNYKLSDINAAIIRAQLQKLSGFIERRRVVATRYQAALRDSHFVLPAIPEGHACSRYVIVARDGDRLRAYLREGGVQAGRGVVFGIHKLINDSGSYPHSDRALEGGVSLPIYPSLTEVEQDRIIQLLLAYKE